MEEIVPIKTVFGEEKSWDVLCDINKEDVCQRAGVVFDRKAEAYILRSFGIDFKVAPCDRAIACDDPRGELFLGKLKDFFRLSVLWYFSSSKDIPFTGKLLRPVDVRGGQRFSAGTHVLPMDKIAERFGRDREGFINKAREFGADVLSGFGDASVKLYPLPRVPVTLVLWMEDDEYDARVDLFYDSSCDFQIELSDIVWSVGIMCALAMLE